MTDAAKLLGIPRTTFYSRLTSEIIAKGEIQLSAPEEHALRRQLRILKSDNKSLLEEVLLERARADIIEKVNSVVLTPPEWTVRKFDDEFHRAIIHAMLSDTHFDERVSKREMGGTNAYNRKIAQIRLQRFFNGLLKLTRHYIAGVKIEGLVLTLGGDILSGIIHDELIRTNCAPILDSCIFWAGEMATGIEMLAKEFPKVFLPCVVGNHGRTKQQKEAKTRVRDNFDWLVYQMLAREFRHHGNVEFLIPDEPAAHFQIYDTRFLLTHGDEFTGGNGIGGISVPILRGDAKRLKVEQSFRRAYDVHEIGHWHTRLNLGSVLINGTLKGYDEWAASKGFEAQPPQQHMLVATPERGLTINAPIFAFSKEELPFWGDE